MALTSPVRFRPYSHIPGTVCLLPGSHFGCEIFPALVRIFDYSERMPYLVGVMRLQNLGPLHKFTVLQDLERGGVMVSGFAASGFIRFKIVPTDAADSRGWTVAFEKGGQEVELEFSHIKEKDTDRISSAHLGVRERLTLGVDKAQEWPQVVRRMNMKEILPYWYMLSQSTALPHEVVVMGTKPSLFKNLQEAIKERERDRVYDHIQRLFLAGFHHMLVPQLEDLNFQGYSLPIADLSGSPLYLLEHSFSLIRKLFFEEIDGRLHILPLVPPEFHSGTLLDIKTSQGHKVSIEWTKHTVRRVLVEEGSIDAFELAFDKSIKSYRHRQKGTRHIFDNFQT